MNCIRSSTWTLYKYNFIGSILFYFIVFILLHINLILSPSQQNKKLKTIGLSKFMYKSNLLFLYQASPSPVGLPTLLLVFSAFPTQATRPLLTLWVYNCTTQTDAKINIQNLTKCSYFEIAQWYLVNGIILTTKLEASFHSLVSKFEVIENRHCLCEFPIHWQNTWDSKSESESQMSHCHL